MASLKVTETCNSILNVFVYGLKFINLHQKLHSFTKITIFSYHITLPYSHIINENPSYIANIMIAKLLRYEMGRVRSP